MKKYRASVLDIEGSFDFEAWKMLAETDPEGFEKCRTQVTRDFISRIPVHKQRRLNGLQWRIDMERRKHSNPLQSCVQIYNMMWVSVYGEHGLANALDRNIPANAESKSADILKFRIQ